MIRALLFWFFTGWKAVKYFGCPPYWDLVKIKIKNYQSGDEKQSEGYYSLTDRFFWRNERGHVDISAKVLDNNNFDALNIYQSYYEVTHWKPIKK